MNFQTLVERVKSLSGRSLVRGTAWLMLAKGARIFIQAAYFILIARALGAEQYGAFAGVVAMVAIATPFSSWGAEYLLVKNVSRNPSLFSTYWGNALLTTSVSGFLLLGLVQIFGQVILPDSIPPLLIFLVGLSDLIFLRYIDATIKSFMAVDQVQNAAKMNVLLSFKNLAAAFLLIQFFSRPTVTQWAFLYAISTIVAALMGIAMTNASIGKPKPKTSLIRPSMQEGFYFSIGLSSQTVYNDIDKTMLASLGTLNATGIYAAAFRLITVSFVPIQALLAASHAKFFKKGEKGIQGSLSLAKRLVPIAALYTSVCMVGLMLFASFIPFILGEEYRGAIAAIRWLSPLLVLKAISYFGADTLTGAGFQRTRSFIQIGIALLNCGLNFWWIPLYSWKGAAWSTLVCDGVLMITLWLLVFYHYRRQNQYQELF